MPDQIVEQIVDYVGALSHSNLNPTVLHQAKRRIIDSLGCAFAAHDAPPVRIAREMAVEVSGSFTARVVGSLARTTPELAAFANGIMVRYLDYSDSALGGNRGGHPSDNLSAVLAVAEAVHAGGRDFLLALTICYEVQCRIADSIPFDKKGWDQPVAGVIGVAAACAKLLSLSPQQLREAVALAVMPNLCSYQTRVAPISMWKGCAGANGARQGIFAAVLASKGMTGPTQPFIGKYGLFALTVGQHYEVDEFVSAGDDFAIALSAMKKHPVRTYGQIMVDTAMDASKKIAGRKITALRLCTFRASYMSLEPEKPESWSATTRETSDHSLLFVVAVALLDGQLTPGTYDRERYLDKDVHDLIRTTTLELRDDYARAYASGIRNCMIEATLDDGTTVSAHRVVTPEDIARGPSDVEIEEKFTRLTADIMQAGQRSQLLSTLWNLEKVEDVSTLVDQMAIT